MNRKHEYVENFSIIEVVDWRTLRNKRGRKIGVCFSVEKIKSEYKYTHGAVIRTFEVLWLSTQEKSAHVQFEDGHVDAFINEFVIRVYTQEGWTDEKAPDEV